MTIPNNKIVHIDQKVEKTTLSKAQKKFNDLIKKIDVQKKLLQEWQHDTIPVYNQRIAEKYVPLLASYNDYRVELVHLLDAAHDNKLFKKTDKAKLRNILIDLTSELIQAHDKEELKELYNKYSESDFDSDDQEADLAVGNIMKEMMAEMFNVKFDDDVDVSSPEKLQAALQEKLQEQQRQHEEKRSKRKKTAKQLEKEARDKQEEKNISKSIQEIYRKLAAALHPDREQDETERDRKTKIMQQVNAAYAKKDLLQLLALQLEFEQINQNQLNTITEDRLKHFNKILQEQLNELQQEIEQIENNFKMRLNIMPFQPLTPKQLLKHLTDDIKGMQQSIQEVKTNIKIFQDPNALKSYLKSYRI